MEVIKECHYHLGGDRKSENYRDVTALVQSYKAMECNTSLKVHFLDYNLRLLPGKSRGTER